MTRSAFTAELVEWINLRLAPPGTRIEADTALFDNALIDSIKILKLIAWTERALDRVIPDQQIRMDYFSTPNRIAEVFIKESHD